MNRAERRAARRGMGRAPASVDAWRRGMLADPAMDRETKLHLLAWSFHADPRSGELALPDDEGELEELTRRYLPRALAWLAINEGLFES